MSSASWCAASSDALLPRRQNSSRAIGCAPGTFIRARTRGCRVTRAAMSAWSNATTAARCFRTRPRRGPARTRNGSTPSYSTGPNYGARMPTRRRKYPSTRSSPIWRRHDGHRRRGARDQSRAGRSPRRRWSGISRAMGSAGLCDGAGAARARAFHLERMGQDARRRNQPRASGGRSRHRRDLLPALARDAGTAGCREGRRLPANPASLPRCLGPRRRPHAARPAGRTEAGRFSVILKPHYRSRHQHAASDLLNPRCMMTPPRDISRLLEIMAALRTPGSGCPWALEQDFSTIAPYTIEESYEVADAIARGDLDDLCGELGDLLLQVVYHARMAEEQNAFAFGDVVEAITRKMIRRHPHVFADRNGQIAASDVKGTWERIKVEEKAERAARRPPEEVTHKSLLSSVKTGQPALKRAMELQRKASS